jgi:hypothetical protein
MSESALPFGGFPKDCRKHDTDVLSDRGGKLSPQTYIPAKILTFRQHFLYLPMYIVAYIVGHSCPNQYYVIYIKKYITEPKSRQNVGYFFYVKNCPK